MTTGALRIGTRGSPLALVQTAMVEARLREAHPDLIIERVIIKTSGDWKPSDGETRLSEVDGGKGMFAHEIERAMLAGEIDCGVHSMKDMASFLPEGLALDHVLERSDPRDAFICSDFSSLKDLPHGAVVGTCSLRRQAFLLQQRPDLKIEPIRGNVQTRLDKLNAGQYAATLLAMAGLKRLGLAGDYIHALSIDDMLPACGQAIVAIETRSDDRKTRSIFDPIHHAETGFCAKIERAALQVLDGSCHTPIGAHARMEGGKMRFDLIVSSGDGTRVYKDSDIAIITNDKEAEDFGRKIAQRLKPSVPADIFS
ncbi:MAG: hydroxymethylbilane synthase [Micavibrio aeruginosavorus]|uniref:Porphobilinogen deaminase n=1 Tax=Micavibrio aeruginosavorus TaxID=349221 RepID=A0A2W5MY34_9BACT|nr:MAG: hydroxymethylbilane synthase [Micavibrio aeruginosavorus]